MVQMERWPPGRNRRDEHHHPQGQVPLAQLGQLATGCLGIEGKSLVMGAEVKDW